MIRPSIVSVLGCGWLGVPLAEALLEKGCRVKGSVTDAAKHGQLLEKGIQPYRLILEKDRLIADDLSFFRTDMVILAVPPRRTPDVESIYPAMIGQIIPFLQRFSVDRVLFISSTSVYPESAGTVSENDAVSPNKDSGKALLKAEELLCRNQSFRTTVLRFGGLIGADRNPARFLRREKGILDGSKPVNLIHRDDCIQLILGLTEQNVWGDIFNACCPLHPSRKEFYEKASAVSGIPVPQFGTESSAGGKIVDSSKLINRLAYKFIYPDPILAISH